MSEILAPSYGNCGGNSSLTSALRGSKALSIQRVEFPERLVSFFGDACDCQIRMHCFFNASNEAHWVILSVEAASKAPDVNYLLLEDEDLFSGLSEKVGLDWLDDDVQQLDWNLI